MVTEWGHFDRNLVGESVGVYRAGAGKLDRPGIAV